MSLIKAADMPQFTVVLLKGVDVGGQGHNKGF